MKTKSSIRNENFSFFIVLTCLILTSCIPQKHLEYIQDPVLEKKIYQLHEKSANLIKPNDELYIRVSSFDDVAFNFFSTQTTASSMSLGTKESISLISYSVNDSGSIYFPILGHVYVKDLTIDENISINLLFW
jgi:polysaccharide export outer membrane protein